MNDSRLPTFIYVVTLALGLLGWAHVYPQLPAVMASHFSARGIPNGWAPKPMFFLIMGIAVFVSALPGFLAPRQIESRPPARLNLPHKDYWLAPERREDTWRFLRAQMAWFSCAVLFVMLYGSSQAINANLPTIAHFNWQGMLYVMGGFVLFCTVWLSHFIWHFYNVPPSIVSPPHTSSRSQ